MTTTTMRRRDDLRSTALRQLTMSADCAYQHPMMSGFELGLLACLYDVPQSIVDGANDDLLINLIMHQMTHLACAIQPVYGGLSSSIARKMLADPRLGQRIRTLHDQMIDGIEIVPPETAQDGHPQDLIGVFFAGRVLGYFPDMDGAEHYRDMLIYNHIFNGL